MILEKISGQNLKIEQNWKKAENFDACFFVIFYRFCQKVIFGEKIGDYVVYPPKFDTFPNFQNFWDPKS